MRHFVVRTIPALALLIGWTVSARAQGYGPGYSPAGPPGLPTSRPAFSPYLNLLRGGDPAISYYGLVKPEFDFRYANQNLQQQINQNASAINTPVDPTTGLPLTGHPVAFMNYSHYFGGAGGAGGRGGLIGRVQGGATTGGQFPTSTAGSALTAGARPTIGAAGTAPTTPRR
jgi:hypothetical protein